MSYILQYFSFYILLLLCEGLFVIVHPAVLCVRLDSNAMSLCQVTSLTISSPVVGLLHLASGQAFNSTFSVNGGIVIQPLLGRQSLICTNRVHHGKVEDIIKIGETIYCASLFLTSHYCIKPPLSKLMWLFLFPIVLINIQISLLNGGLIRLVFNDAIRVVNYKV
jgi:hypothetical protein